MALFNTWLLRVLCQKHIEYGNMINDEFYENAYEEELEAT